MKEISIQELIDTNYRVLTLLGYATSLVMGYKKYAHDDEVKKCEWLIKAIDNVIYKKLPLPEFPE